MLCSREGILVDSVVVNKSLLASWLERLTDVDWSENPIYALINPGSSSETSDRIHALLSPKDAQDVPRAIKLLNLCGDLCALDKSDFDPSECVTHNALSLLGEMLEALVEPFINHEWSLSEQITSLVKFSHIACALFLKHESAFMPQHLYSDLQCMVRTAIFRVAHTKILNPELKVFLCLLGDDVLEVLFGRVRMIGSHSPNVDIEELCNRIGSALRLDDIFQEYPKWERRPHRLKLKRSRDADHLSPRNWKGELRASSCNLLSCWANGVSQAQAVLARFGYVIDFGKHFHDGQKRGVDLMRPKGGKYPGISSEVDQSLGEAGEGLEDIVEDFSFQSYDGKAAYEAEMNETRQITQTHSIWMDLDGGKPGHKKTILRLHMDPTLDVDYNKSHDRLLRIRYFSIGGDKWDRSKPSTYHGAAKNDLFGLRSLYATLVSVNQKVCIAVLQCTLLKSGSQYLDCAPIDEIALRDSAYDVSGQILSLLPAEYEVPGNSSDGSDFFWVWDSHFVALESVKSTPRSQLSNTTRVRHVSISVNGRLVYPLRPSQFRSIQVAGLPSVSEIIPPTIEKTWSITENVFKDIESHLYDLVRNEEETRFKIPAFGPVREGSFPYRAAAGISNFI
jgi:hypothetical protein